MGKTVPFLNVCISIIAFVATLGLIAYMLISLLSGLFDVAFSILDAVFLDASERQSIFAVLNGEFVYNLAFLIILVKVYAVLMTYLKTYTIDSGQVVELAMVASLLELIFNSNQHSDHMQLILAGLAVLLFAIYVIQHRFTKMNQSLPEKSVEAEEKTERVTRSALAKKSVVRVKKTARKDK